MSSESLTDAAGALQTASSVGLLDRIQDAAATPQGLIIAVLAGFIVLTLLITLLGFLAVGLLRRRAKPQNGSIDSPAVPLDPLAAAKPPKRRSTAPIGLARLRDETPDFSAAMAEPRLAPQAPAASETAVQPLPPGSPAAEQSARLAAALDGASLLQTLPFAARPGLETAHADIDGIGVEAVFFDPDVAALITDEPVRLVPFLPAGAAQTLFSPEHRETLRADGLYARPDAVLAIAGGLLTVKRKPWRIEPREREAWAQRLRRQDLLEAVVDALAASAELARPAAPLLRLDNAVFFLRPSPAAAEKIQSNVAAADAFLSKILGPAIRPAITAKDYAALLAAAFSAADRIARR